jgi:uncharacterized protein YbjT (DUF2867 family)
MRCLIAGASGLVGNKLLTELLDEPQVTSVTALVRKPLAVKNAKLETVITSFEQIENFALTPAEIAFCCLGTTIKTAGSKEDFFHIDHDLIIHFAQAAFKAGVTTFIVVSALGADPKSSVFYNQVKGQTEEDLKKIGFKKLAIVRPSLLLGDRNESRPAERIAQLLSPILKPLMIGPLAKSRPIEASKVAHKMKLLAFSESFSGSKIILNHEI